MPQTAVVVLAPGFEEIEAVTAIDVLRRAEVEVTVAGLEAARVEASRRTVVQADAVLAEIERTPDLLVLPGGMPGASHLGESTALWTFVEAVLQAGGTVGAICAAPACTLAAWGLLEGRRATCYPGFEERFGPGVTHVTERVVVDGNIITSRGPGTALEFALALVEQVVGADVSAALHDGMLVQ